METQRLKGAFPCRYGCYLGFAVYCSEFLLKIESFSILFYFIFHI